MPQNTENVQPAQGNNREQIVHHEDLASKFAMQFFGNELLCYLGIHQKVQSIEPTEIVRLEARQMYEDFNFQMEDGTWNHLEFESDSILTEDLLSDLGTVASDLTARITNEKNDETLRKWHRLAAKSESIDQFVAKM